MESVKSNGLKLNEQIFRDHPVLQAAYDTLSVGLIVGGIYLLNTYTRNLTLSFAVFLLFTGLALFLGNRKRLESFTSWLKKKLR